MSIHDHGTLGYIAETFHYLVSLHYKVYIVKIQWVAVYVLHIGTSGELLVPELSFRGRGFLIM